MSNKEKDLSPESHDNFHDWVKALEEGAAEGPNKHNPLAEVLALLSDSKEKTDE